MTDERTVEPIYVKDAPAHDLSPTGPAIKAPEGMDNITVVQKTANFVPLDSKKRQATTGEKIHWGLTYIGGDWILNSAVGVSFTFLTARTEVGKKYLIKPASEALEWLCSLFVKNPETVKKGVSGGLNFLSIMVGGTVINPILTTLEGHKHKKTISKFFDTLFYGKDKVAQDPKFQEAYENIDKEPLKDTKSVWISRFIALAPLLVIASTPKAYEFMKSNDVPLIKHLNFDSISNFTRKTAEKIGIKPKRLMERFEVNPTTGKSISDWQALHDFAGFDYGLTILYAVLHAVTFPAVAKVRHDMRHKKAEQKEMAMLDVTPAAARLELPEPALTHEKPTAKISQMAYDQPLAQVQQAAQLS